MRPLSVSSAKAAVLLALMLFASTVKPVLGFIVARGWPDALEILALGLWNIVLVELSVAAVQWRGAS